MQVSDAASVAICLAGAGDVMPDTTSLDQLKAKAPEAAEFLRQLANPNRLLLLCQLSQGERSVGELQNELGLKQPALSQQLADLRQSGFVQARRQSRQIYYSLRDRRAQAIMDTLYAIFCADAGASRSHPQPAGVEPPR
jgi:DNA-binding transcriptional ArsR family regulator